MKTFKTLKNNLFENRGQILLKLLNLLIIDVLQLLIPHVIKHAIDNPSQHKIINDILNNTKNQKLENIDNQQTKKPQQDSTPVFEKIILESLKHLHSKINLPQPTQKKKKDYVLNSSLSSIL